MPNVDMLSGYGQGVQVTDPRWTPTDVVDAISIPRFAATQDIRTIDTYLAAANAGYWTATRLNQESFNDKVFWIRTMEAPLGLS